MRAYPRLFQKLFCQPVLVLESVRYSLESVLLQRMGLNHGGIAPSADIGDSGRPIQEWIQFSKDYDATLQELRIENIYKRFGNVAVVSLDGVIDKHVSQFEMDCYGAADIADFDTALNIAAADPKVERVVLHINSPGGSVTGIAESAARVAALAEEKEVHAFVDVMACSAAYWIASQADHLAAAPSAILGSIGVYMAVIDGTRAAEMEGYKVDLITAGRFKAMGSPFKPLSDEERGMLQNGVTAIHGDFKAAVRAGRRRATEAGGHQSVSDSVMEGQWFDGKVAFENRLADELTGANVDEYVSALL